MNMENKGKVRPKIPHDTLTMYSIHCVFAFSCFINLNNVLRTKQRAKVKHPDIQYILVSMRLFMNNEKI